MRQETRTFPGIFESLPKIRNFVVQAAQKAGFGEADVYAVELAVDEACSNIIEHAYGGEGVGDINCTCQITDIETATCRCAAALSVSRNAGDPGAHGILNLTQPELDALVRARAAPGSHSSRMPPATAPRRWHSMH